MSKGSTTVTESDVLPLTDWPIKQLRELDWLLRTRAPELGVRLLQPLSTLAPTERGRPWHGMLLCETGEEELALVLSDVPEWLTHGFTPYAPGGGGLALVLPVARVLQVCACCDLVALDSAWRLGGWEAVLRLLRVQVPAVLPVAGHRG